MLTPVFSACDPRPEILGGDLSLELFAAKLRLVVEGRAPEVYGDPKRFFEHTFPTDGLRTLITEVFGRLSGQSVGSPVIRLETSFGGGKTHDEIALWHIARQGRQIDGITRFVDDPTVIPDRPVQVAAIDGRDLDPETGVYHAATGVTTYTLWGEIAYQIGGIDGYELLRGSDEKRISPGTPVLERLVGGQPTVIMLDEIARCLRSAKAKVVAQSTLADQVVAFFFSLMDFAASCDHVVFVYSLASESDTFAKETVELQQELMRASARQERVLSPSSDIEIYNIVRQRLFSRIEADAAQKASDAYTHSYRSSRVNLPDSSKDASYAQAIANSYPFHPELFGLLTKKIASIPEFQRTRGALRLLARVVGYLWNNQGDRPQDIPLIHTHHVPVGINAEITNDLTSRLSRKQMRVPIGADIYNPDGREAYAQTQDKDWLAAKKPPFSSWVSRTIFLHSLTQGVSSGIRRAELNLSLLTPGLDLNFIDRAIDRLTEVAWYLDVDPMTTIARFKEEPSINKIIAEEKELVGLTDAKDDLRARRDSIFAKKFFERVSSPDGAQDVDDDPTTIALCILDFNEAKIDSPEDPPPPLVEQMFNNTGESGKFRVFRNRLLFLLANRQELDRAIDLAREYKAIQNILVSPNRLGDLSDNQQKQLKTKKGEMDLAVRVALTNTYRHLFYPAKDSMKAPKGLMHYTLPTQDSSSVKGNRNQQYVILKALKDCAKVRDENIGGYAPAYVLQKVWPPGLDRLTTKGLRDQFSKDLGLSLFLDAEVDKLRETIKRGLEAGQWDLKVGDRVFVKTEAGSLSLPQTIEFSDRFELYRRGILEPPKPREIQLSVQVSSVGEQLTAALRWKTEGARSVALYRDGLPIEVDREWAASDFYDCPIKQMTKFRVVADYGSGETAEAVKTVYGQGQTKSEKVGDELNGNYGDQGDLLNKPTTRKETGTPNKVFNGLSDFLTDQQKLGLTGVRSLTLTVDSVMDYRKLGTSLPLLGRLNPTIDQSVTIDTEKQHIDLTYEGEVRGFQAFFSTINGLLNQSDTRANVNLTLRFEFDPPIAPEAGDLKTIQQALTRNPVARMVLEVSVEYQ